MTPAFVGGECLASHSGRLHVPRGNELPVPTEPSPSLGRAKMWWKSSTTAYLEFHFSFLEYLQRSVSRLCSALPKLHASTRHRFCTAVTPGAQFKCITYLVKDNSLLRRWREQKLVQQQQHYGVSSTRGTQHNSLFRQTASANSSELWSEWELGTERNGKHCTYSIFRITNAQIC